MASEYEQVGFRLRAYRLGAGLSAEEVADKLCLSRATVYRLEKSGITRLDTLYRIARLFNVSIASLLGVDVEYIKSAVTYFERLRQLERTADWCFVAFGPISYLLTSSEYDETLHRALIATIPAGASDFDRAMAEIAETMSILARRKTEYKRRKPSITSLLSASDIRYFARWGLGGPDMKSAENAPYIDAAHRELERVSEMMAHPPFRVQLGILQETLPTTSFNIVRRDNQSLVTISPFRLGPQPNVRKGVAMVTPSDEAVTLYSEVAREFWDQAVTGEAAAAFIREEIRSAIDTRPEPGDDE